MVIFTTGIVFTISGSDGRVPFLDCRSKSISSPLSAGEVDGVSSETNTVVGDLLAAYRIFPPIRVNEPGGNDDGA